MTARPLVPILVVFIGGLVAAEFFSSLRYPACLIISALVAFLLFCLVFLKPSEKTSTAIILVLFFLCGGLLEFAHRPEMPLRKAALSDSRVTMEGTVTEPSSHQDGMTRISVRVDRILNKGVFYAPGERVRVSIFGEGLSLFPGQRILFPARLRPFRNFKNPGRYDYEAAMETKGFSCAASVSDGRRVVVLGTPGRFGWPRDLIEDIRGRIRDLLQRELDEKSGPLLRALILGERQGIPVDLREAFQRSGLAHMLAVSGLHVGLVAWFSFGLMKWGLSRSYGLLLAIDVRKAAALFTCFPVAVYALVAGFQVSTQRALIMVLAFLASIVLGREKEVWSTLCLAALVILAVNPGELHTVSFQLSFGAVAGILWLAPPIYRRIPNPFPDERGAGRRFGRVFDYAGGLVSVTLAAVIFLMPLTVYYFHRISLTALPANLIATPVLALWTLPLGLIAVFIHPLSPTAGELALQGAALGVGAMERLVRFFAGFEWASLWAIAPTGWEVPLLYGIMILGVFVIKSRSRWGFLALCLVLVCDAGYWVYESRLRDDLRVTYLDVGQGNSALIQFPRGKRMLVDGGGFRFGGFDVGRMVVAPFLWRQKIARVDYLVLSHPQADHMNGLVFIAENFSPRELWSNGDGVEGPAYGRFLRAIESSGVETHLPGDGGIPGVINGVGIEILHPLQGRGQGAPGTDLNERSLVLRLSYHGRSFLFPGDLGALSEASLNERVGEDLQSDVLLAPHHGSRMSCTRPFLLSVRPSWCVVSSGAGNSHGHPHAEALSRLRAAGARILRTDQDGAVRVTARHGDISVWTFSSGALN